MELAAVSDQAGFSSLLQLEQLSSTLAPAPLTPASSLAPVDPSLTLSQSLNELWASASLESPTVVEEKAITQPVASAAIFPQVEPITLLPVSAPAELTGLADSPLVGIIDQEFCLSAVDGDSNLDVALFSGLDLIDNDSDPITCTGDFDQTAPPAIIAATEAEAVWVGRAAEQSWATSLIEFVNTARALNFEQAIVSIPAFSLETDIAPPTTPQAAPVLPQRQLTSFEQLALSYALDSGVAVILPVAGEIEPSSAIAITEAFSNVVVTDSAEDADPLAVVYGDRDILTDLVPLTA
ncbi:MAG: hypothetical protein AAF289_09340 [Cyanobacteria bacterium P01_A01_bin.135]